MIIVYVSSQLNWWCWWWNARDDNDGDDGGDDDGGDDDDDDANEMNVMMLLLMIMLLMIMMMMSKTWISMKKILFEIWAQISKSILLCDEAWCVMYFLIEYCVLHACIMIIVVNISKTYKNPLVFNGFSMVCNVIEGCCRGVVRLSFLPKATSKQAHASGVLGFSFASAWR